MTSSFLFTEIIDFGPTLDCMVHPKSHHITFTFACLVRSWNSLPVNDTSPAI